MWENRVYPASPSNEFYTDLQYFCGTRCFEHRFKAQTRKRFSPRAGNRTDNRAKKLSMQTLMPFGTVLLPERAAKVNN
ncbi:MAG: hypothetical protein LBV68_05010 [Spirochaetaceae bacterium]|nr:hypothetical protein [Spirochaetaceae bacterium]